MAYYQPKNVISIFVSLLPLALCSFHINYWNETGLNFDSDFNIYPRRNSSEKLLLYDPTHICILTKINGSIFISIKSLIEYKESNPIKISSSNIEVHACFSYNGKSFLWVKDENTISTSKLISMPNKVQYVNIFFEFLRFDVLSQNFLTYLNGHISIYNFVNPDQTLEFVTARTIKTNSTCTDIHFINEKIYCIENKSIYMLNSNFLKFYSPYFADHFQFVIYPKITNLISAPLPFVV